MNRPLILVSNDDGISAPGIRRLISIMNDIGDVVVVAPEGPRSGMGHAITIESKITCEKVVNTGPQIEFSCSGTPVDCIKLAIYQLLDRKPDLCVSGINHGSNSSINVIYSGTMAAAIEGTIEGIPSIGFSLLDSALDADFTESDKYIREITKSVLASNIESRLCLNVNIPKSIDGEFIRGIKICRQSDATWEEEFVKSKDDKGKISYLLTGKFVNLDKGTDTDEWALINHYISVVPIQFDMTAHNLITKLKNIL